MPHMLRYLILIILLFCRTLLSCLNLHSKVPLFHTNALTAVLDDLVVITIYLMFYLTISIYHYYNNKIKKIVDTSGHIGRSVRA